MSTKQRPIDLLKNATRYKIVKADIDIPLDGEAVLEAYLSAPDIWSIRKEQEWLYDAALEEAELKGFGKKPIRDDEWQEQIKDIDANTEEGQKTLQYMEKEKPKNRAQQKAQKIVRFETIQGILPKFLYDRSTGKLLFPTPGEQQAFIEIVKQNTELFTLLANAYTTLAAQVEENKETVKNS